MASCRFKSVNAQTDRPAGLSKMLAAFGVFGLKNLERMVIEAMPIGG